MSTILQPRWHPKLFSAPMVLRLLDGSKSQTRRGVAYSNSLVNGGSFPRKLWPDLHFDRAWVDPGPSPAGNSGPYLKVPFTMRDEAGVPEDEAVYRVYPRVQVGDFIWPRETFARAGDGYVYRADLTPEQLAEEKRIRRAAPKLASAHRWTPGIHMPRAASRISLEVTEVRAQRLHDISEDDARAEGVDPSEWAGGPAHEAPRAAFKELWIAINGRESWEANGWVWAYTFKRLHEGRANV